MQTGAAARTYNILMAENRKVAAALIAVPSPASARRGARLSGVIPSGSVTSQARTPEGSARIELVPDSLRQHLKQAGIGLDVMQTGAAARTYNILMAENRKQEVGLAGLGQEGCQALRGDPVRVGHVPGPDAGGQHLKQAGIGLDVMQTGAAARTYNILMAENRKVAARAAAPVCITSRPIPACFRCWRRESGTNTISAPVP
jgi:uncharacterized protein